jgi:hypothetical protein
VPHFERSFPPVLSALHTLDRGEASGACIDFTPFRSFMAEDDTNTWFRTWTRNEAPGPAPYRLFGADSQGGHAGFWLIRPATPVIGQPIVYFGAERRVGVVARSFSDYLWLLAGGVGPAEAILDRPPRPAANKIFSAFAKKHAQGGKKPRREILAAARARFPTFETELLALCR